MRKRRNNGMVSSENVVYVYENHEKSDELGLDEL